MGYSVAQELALMDPGRRQAVLAALDDAVIEEMNRGEWWFTARPEQIPPPGDWLVCLFLAGRGAGKLLALDTPVATPTGMRTLRDIRVGDTVLDEQGKPCRVTNTWDDIPSRAYRVTFNDGTTVDACDEHEWVTWTHSARKAYNRTGHEGDRSGVSDFPDDWVNWAKTSRWGHPTGVGATRTTTQGIADTLTHGGRGDLNHCVPVTRPLQLSEVHLPLDPWLLGYWLGNGDVRGSSLTCHEEDARFVADRCHRLGFPAVMRSHATAQSARTTPTGLHPVLRDMGVLRNKHVPDRYLWASEGQRRALLAGLLDSDGYCGRSVEFCSMDEGLAEAVLHLARSLGERPVLAKGRATLNGVDHGPKYRVTWRGHVNPFTSPRKRDMWQAPGKQALRNRHRMVTSVEPVLPVPMRCLEVDSPNHMYLVTDAMIPTHNSRSASEWLAQRILDHPYDRHGNPTEWLLIAETLSDARAINVDGPSGLLSVLRRRRVDHRYKQTPRPMVLFPDGQKVYLEGADDPDVGRGYNAAGAVLDEIGKWKYSYESWYEGILPSLRMDLIGDHPRAFVTTTPKPVKIIQEWYKQKDGSVHLIGGSTFDNAVNLSAHVLRELKRRYAGTTLGEQELYGRIIELVGGGLFGRDDILRNRVWDVPDDIVATVVGMDPNLTGSDAETGIVVACRTRDSHLYVLADRTIPGSGRQAALAAWRAVAEFQADMLAYEENLGKRYLQEVLTDAYHEMVDQGMFPRNTTPPMKPVHASHGKKTRAEPVAMRGEQGRLHMVGEFEELENQMVLYDPQSTRESPDRMDAMVHACLQLILGEKREMRIADPGQYDLGLNQQFYDLSRLLG